MDKVKIAAVQPRTAVGPGCNEHNMAYALARIDEASANGADIITLPETYPGPWREPYDGFDALEEISSKARQVGKYILYGFTERAKEAPGRHYLVHAMVGPTGKMIAKYRRTSPVGPWIYTGGDFWDIEYIAAGPENLQVYNTEVGRIGILVCSEVFVPELSRILALKGAEITFMPAGLKKWGLRDNWELLLRARAIENQMYTVSCQNLLPDFPDDAGLAVICGPEGQLVKSYEEGIIYDVADLERIRWLHKTEDTMAAMAARAYNAKPGLLTKQWRRVELFNDLLNEYNPTP